MNNKMFNKISGDSGEKIAVDFLTKKGYKIIKTNFKNKIGEIDIIARDGKILVFVEVKFRSSDYFGLPREAVNIYKQQKIRRVAEGYIASNRLFSNVFRFDVVEILGDKITHIENCF